MTDEISAQRRRKRGSARPTQSDVARLAGVSVPVVSAVLNGSRGTVRVSPDVAERVQRIIRQVGYVPNPIARSLVNSERNILGVFTFDPIFPHRREDFFYPFLQGIESAVEGSGLDLLLLTGAPMQAGRRSLFANGANRLALADGGIVLGERQNRDELARLADDGFPFVVIGRREIPGKAISFVGAAYAPTTRAMVERAWKLGHRRYAFVGATGDDERQMDRRSGFRAGLDGHEAWDPESIHLADTATDWVSGAVDFVRGRGASIVFAEDAEIAEGLDRRFAAEGMTLPRDLSLCVLTHPRSEYGNQRQFARLVIPRVEMGAEAVRMLLRLLKGGEEPPLTLTLDCSYDPGTTFGPPPP